MPQRPFRSLAVVVLLALGDYLLWNWSLGANHDIVALVSGMTLIPLLIALAWLLVVAVVRLIAHTTRRSSAGVIARAGSRAYARAAHARETGVSGAVTPTSGGEVALGDPAGAVAGRATATSPSSKLAA